MAVMKRDVVIAKEEDGLVVMTVMKGHFVVVEEEGSSATHDGPTRTLHKGVQFQGRVPTTALLSTASHRSGRPLRRCPICVLLCGRRQRLIVVVLAPLPPPLPPSPLLIGCALIVSAAAIAKVDCCIFYMEGDLLIAEELNGDLLGVVEDDRLVMFKSHR